VWPDLAVSQDKKPEKDEIIRVDTQLVDVPVAVTTTAGVPLRGLKQSNFVVYEDGKPQEIADFAAAAEPFEIALVLDTSGSARGQLPLIQRAAAEFLANLRPGDRVAVIAYNTDRRNNQAFAITEVLSQLTGDRKVLKSAVDHVTFSNGTPYYDSLLQVAEGVFARPPSEEFRGRRALVALTDGVDSSSTVDFALAKTELESRGLISFFIKVDTRDYFEENLLGDCQSATQFSKAQIRRYYRSIAAKGNMEKAFNFCDLGDFERLAISKRLYEIADTEMESLAKSSGGKVFAVDDLNEARVAFKSVAEEIGTKYTIGYYPANDKKDGTFRKIRVELKGLPAGTKVRAREGYTAPKN
jgi:VWFA-related protein